MQLVKVNDKFYNDCVAHNTDSEIMFNEKGRPCVLLIQMKYKEKLQKFVVPLRSNISGKTPDWQYCKIPPNRTTKPGNKAGVHYIKLFPITDTYIEKFNVGQDQHMVLVKGILDKKEQEIVKACKDYLAQVEKGNKHSMTPDIDGILSWL